MKSSLDNMKSLLLTADLYNLDNSNIEDELKAYACVLDEFYSKITTLLCECFVNTSSSYGLDIREKMLGAVRDDLSILKRREQLILRESIDQSSFTKEKIEGAIRSFGISDFEIVEYPSQYKVEVNIDSSHTDAQKKWIKSQIEMIMPAHLSVVTSFTA